MGLARAISLASLIVYSLPTKLMTLQSRDYLLRNEQMGIPRTRWFHQHIQRQSSHGSMREPTSGVYLSSFIEVRMQNSRTIGLSSGVASPLNAFGSPLASKSLRPCARALHAPLISEIPCASASNMDMGGSGVSSVGVSTGEVTKEWAIRAVAISSYVETNTCSPNACSSDSPLGERSTYPTVSSQARRESRTCYNSSLPWINSTTCYIWRNEHMIKCGYDPHFLCWRCG